MAKDSKKAEAAADDGDFLPDMPVETADENSAETLAIGLENLEEQALDGGEVARQIEELTGVVLSSAEVSTRSAEVAANISHEMRTVMKTVNEMSSKNILHSRIILIGLLSFLVIAVGTFFAISTRLQQNIRQLDSLSLAVGKRVVTQPVRPTAITRHSPRLSSGESRRWKTDMAADRNNTGSRGRFGAGNGPAGNQRNEYKDRKKAIARAKAPKISTFFWPGVRRFTPRPKLRFSSKPLGLSRGPMSLKAPTLLRHTGQRKVTGSRSTNAVPGAMASFFTPSAGS